MSLQMMVRFLVTRAYIEHDTNPFLSAVFRLAQRSGGSRSKERQFEYLKALFTSMTIYHGSGEMLNGMQGASLSFHRLLSADKPKRLSVAIALGKLKHAKILLEGGVDVNITSDFGSPLAIAVNAGRIDVVRTLLDNGAKVNHGVRVFPARWTPYQCTWRASVFAGKGQSLTILPHGRYVIVSSSDGDEEATYRSTKSEQEKLLRVLMHTCAGFLGSRYVMAIMDGTTANKRGSAKIKPSHDIQIDLRDRTDHTALHRSSQKGFWHLTRFLLENGASVHAYCEHRGKRACPLSLALENGHHSVVKLLLDYGASVHPSIWQARLQQAIRRGNITEVSFLCSLNRKHLAVKRLEGGERGREAQWVTFGSDLLQTAISKSRHDIVRLLVEDYGADAGGMGQV